MKKLSKDSKHIIYLLNRGNAVNSSNYSDIYGIWTIPKGCIKMDIKDINDDIIESLDDITKKTLTALLETGSTKLIFINDLDLAINYSYHESERNLLRYLNLMNRNETIEYNSKHKYISYKYASYKIDDLFLIEDKKIFMLEYENYISERDK